MRVLLVVLFSCLLQIVRSQSVFPEETEVTGPHDNTTSDVSTESPQDVTEASGGTTATDVEAAESSQVLYLTGPNPIRPGLLGKPVLGPRPDENWVWPRPFPPNGQTPAEGQWVKPRPSNPDREGEDEYTQQAMMNMTRVREIKAECQDDYMKISVELNGTFTGLIYSTGYAYDPGCVYVNGSGRNRYEFYIELNRCGTLGGNNRNQVDTTAANAMTKSFMWNTLTVQYNSMIEEEWDEHFKVTCEYGYDIWKTVTFPVLDVNVATGNPVVFTLTPPECYMEIRYGYGTTGNRITGPVHVGDPLTLLIYMRSQYDGFDIIVNNCFAHNGGAKKINLIDGFGCPVDEKLISRFQGAWAGRPGGASETKVYAYLKAFRFTGSPALYLECDVRMCHGYCPTQPCHWRQGRTLPGLEEPGKLIGRVKRKITDTRVKRNVVANTPSWRENAAMSETLSLFQSLEVLNKDEAFQRESKQDIDNYTDSEDSDFCLPKDKFAVGLGIVCILLLVAIIVTFLFCLRIRKIQRRKEADSFFSQQYTPQDFRPSTLTRLK